MFKKLWMKIWNEANGKKLWAMISATFGYGLATLQERYPECLPLTLPLIGAVCLPWSWILLIIGGGGYGTAIGHKMVKRVQRDGALI